MDNFLEILSFHSGYNTALVLFSTIILGIAAALVGSFVLLKKQNLVADAVSHATLPGIGGGFLLAYALGINEGRHLPTLLAGAALTGLLAGLSVKWILTHTRLRQDTAIASVLSAFYGLGIVLLSAIQRLESAAQAGLDSFLLGQASGLSTPESITICALSFLTLLIILLFFKELFLLCFDESFARSIGKPADALDTLLIFLMLAVVCAGLKTVGLILILALLIVPAITARFWSDNLKIILPVACFFGGMSCYIGVALSAAFSDTPTGAAIVLCATALFFVSFLFAPRYGLISTKIKIRSGQ